MIRRYSAKDEAFFRAMMFPEEDRHRFTCKPWDGSFRWFRSDNVNCLEHYRRPIDQVPKRTKPADTDLI
jgi:hypothetical protein